MCVCIFLYVVGWIAHPDAAHYQGLCVCVVTVQCVVGVGGLRPDHSLTGVITPIIVCAGCVGNASRLGSCLLETIVDLTEPT